MVKKVSFPPLTPVQQEVYDSSARFKVLACGRRFGKSWLARQKAIDLAINEGKKVWFVSPTNTNGNSHWRMVKRMVGDLPTYKNERQRYLEFDYGGKVGTLEFKTGDVPENLRGDGLDLIVVDEAAFTAASLWYDVLLPSLADGNNGQGGEALIISTPNGVVNWFFDIWALGQNPDEHEYKSWRMPSSANPYLKKEVIESARRTTPELKFKQEWLAEFISDAGGVFRRIEDVSTAKIVDDPVPGDTYYFGIDWGRRNDYTVISIFNQDGVQVHLDQFAEIGFNYQRQLVEVAYNKWRPAKMYIESNNVGAAQIEELQRVFPENKLVPVYITNPLKTELVEHLALNIELGRIKLLSKDTPIGSIQQTQFMAYIIKRTRSGLQVTYQARPGHHDDIISANLLVNQVFNNEIQDNKILTSGANPFYGGSLDPAVKEMSPDELEIFLKAQAKEKAFKERLRRRGRI